MESITQACAVLFAFLTVNECNRDVSPTIPNARKVGRFKGWVFGNPRGRALGCTQMGENGNVSGVGYVMKRHIAFGRIAQTRLQKKD